MGKVFAKIKNWFIAHRPTKRRLIQVYAALLYNANIKGFAEGEIYTGNTKRVCVPGLNCYSCPGAIGACPLGALQDSLAQSGTRAPAYIFGILILFGLLLGRTICGFLCPFGLIQELLYKIRTPKLRKSKATRILSLFKYFLLIIIIAIPIIYAGIPSFCKYICPAGTLEGALSLLAAPENANFFEMLGYLFSWKFLVLVAVIVACIFIYRAFCRFICPLGAIYSFFCRVALLGVKLDKSRCISCGLCVQGCKMDVKHVGDRECINCGECISVCPVNAIRWKGSEIFIRDTSPASAPALAEGEKINLLALSGKRAAVTAVMPAETQPEGKSVAQTEQEVQTAPVTAKKPSRGAAIAAAFRRPRFVTEFVAWVVALAVLIAAIVGYAVTGSSSTLVYGEGDKCPEFILSTYYSAGAKDEFSTYSHGKVTVINFWYTDCDPCKAELPEFEKVYEEMSGEIEMYAVHSWSALPDGKLGEDGLSAGVTSFLTSTDKNGRVWNTYLLTFAQDTEELDIYTRLGGRGAYPMTVVLDKNGKIADLHTGACSESELREMIQNAS